MDDGSQFGGTGRPAVPVFVVALFLYVAFGLRSLSVVGLKGDEPHYVIIAHSLLADGDLLIENNHQQRDYRSFTREELPPDFMQRGQNGQIYSIHAPGLPALLVLPYAIGGQYGVMVAMALLGALATAAIAEVATTVAGPAVGVLTALAIGLSVPFVPYAWSVFPEMAGAAIVAWAVLWVVSDKQVTPAQWMARGVCLALLPWLHTKFIIFLAGFTMVLLLRHARAGTLNTAAAALGPVVLSVAAWFASFYVIYGTPNPEAPYGASVRDSVKLENVPRGVLGLLFDQKFGLLVYAPIYLLVPIGWWLALRDRRWRWPVTALAAVAVAFVASTARFYMWWGGWSGPARFLVPVLPLVAPAMALASARARGTRWQLPIAALVGLSLTIALVSAVVPGQLLLFSEAHGVGRLVERMQGAAPLTATLPTFTESQWRPVDLVPRPYSAGARDEAVIRGRIGLLDTYAPSNRWAYDYSTRRALDAEQWRRAGTITGSLAGHLHGPVAYLDDRSYPEGEVFWTRGTERARVLIAAAGHGALTVIAHVGPGGGTVNVRVGEQEVTMPMAANETRQQDFEVPSDAAWVPIAVEASSAFRPSDVDPTSRDQRLLGAQVRVVLR